VLSFPLFNRPDMRLLAEYANAHNWYAAPENFVPRFLQERLSAVSYNVLFQNSTKGYLRFFLNFVVTEIDRKSL